MVERVFCAGCKFDITNFSKIWSSRLDPPNSFKLCGPCYYAESILIQKKRTSNIPSEVKRYENNLK